ncbi:MAG TPA: hypothetical protein PKV98_07795 [Burkholderiaceae bacterium]|nr:hypothetical protein [Burkholderiaceae bacterium]
MPVHIPLAEELLTWFLIGVGIVGVAYLLATWIIRQAEEYPYDDEL